MVDTKQAIAKNLRARNENVNSPGDTTLHKVFVDPLLKTDLSKEELGWFKSKICASKVENEIKEPKADKGTRLTKIIMGEDLEKQADNNKKLYLKLSETDTIWFLSIETSYSENTLEDAEKVRRENDTYEKKKTKKELIRKRCMADAQTPKFIEKSVGTLTMDINIKDAGVFASEWDLYDTYNALGKSETGIEKDFPKSSQLNKRKEYCALVTDIQNSNTEDQAVNIFSSSNFRYASLVTERLLASNYFQSEQSVFKKTFKLEYDEEPTLFSYKMEPLWSFQKEFKSSLMVTDMDWNPLNKAGDILAIGYGDLRFQKNSPGFICLWSPKNPRQPERQFSFNDSVTSLHFSRTRPNVLAVGTRTGNVYVLNVSSLKGNMRIIGRDSYSPHPGPIWKVEWFQCKELIFENEELLAIGESGILMRFSEEMTTDILKLDYVTSTKKKIDKKSSKKLRLGKYVQEVIFDKKTFSGLWFSISFNRNFCYIATKEGVVVKCNMRNPSMTEGLFLAHDGPVYTLQHSPFTDLIFFTCGADWTIKIWMEGILEPLIILQNKTPVMCAKWSPTIPTLIASIGETKIHLWDIARNILAPMSTKSFEGCEKPFSNCLFSWNGKNLIVGSQDGLARVIHLSELPRIPFLKKEALISAIKKALSKNEDGIVNEFRRVLDSNENKLKTEIMV